MQVRYIPKQISEVNPKDLRVSIVGKVIAASNNSFILSDDTGKIEIISDSQVEKGRLVRVFCSVIEEKLKADVIQDLEGLDLNLFKKVKELYNKAGI
ncbi:MAG: hypothetical protein QW818_02055 [Candidatus Aenigmatarchaeota archaeon]|nr:hypothetical protein [Candidatus Aenigmarchaeota archaeon]